MDLHETYLANRSQIADQVLAASEARSIPTVYKPLGTTGALVITQPGNAVALTSSQVRDLMARISAMVNP